MWKEGRRDDDEEGEMINDIKGGEMAVRVKIDKKKKINGKIDCDCEFKCECDGLVSDIPDTCKYCYLRMKMSIKDMRRRRLRSWWRRRRRRVRIVRRRMCRLN